jgi:hypothetical protein
MQAEYHLIFGIKNRFRPESSTSDVSLIVNHLLLFHVFADSTHNSCGQSYLEPL